MRVSSFFFRLAKFLNLMMSIVREDEFLAHKLKMYVY